ncbi:MAG: hypothetical protein J6S67_21825 [Methanobrevibacter sp.]|nr:hypothetical protein [Methanobrevibacter sp.]
MMLKDKIAVFLAFVTAILVFVVVCMFYQNKALKAEKNALAVDVIRYKQNLIEMEKQNEVLLQAEKENEQFKQDLFDDKSDNLDVAPAPYILNKLHKD